MENQKILSNFIWRFAERCGAQLVTFIVSIVLARLLNPDTYGTIALITVFINIVQIFVDSGLGSALIQKKEADDTDFSTVFYANVLFCLALYALLFAAAPAIADFYHNTSLVPMIRVLSLTVVVAGLKNVQQAYVSRHMMFKRFFYSTLCGTICAAAIGILLAYNGYGIWALIAQNLTNVIVDTMILWITVRWRPGKVFSAERFQELFSYGWKLMASAVLDTGYENLRALVIGRLYSSTELGLYNQGNKIPGFLANNLNTSIDSVLLPAMSNAQDEREHVKNMTRRSITVSIYILAPLMIGMSAAAKPLIRVLLTDKWLDCFPYLRIFCITYMFWPIHTANLNAIKAVGRSDLFLKMEIMKKCVGMALLLATMHYGVMAMAYSLLVSSVTSQIINSWPNKKLLNYKYSDQIRDILPGITAAVVMGGVIYPMVYLDIPDILMLAVQMVSGASVYLLISVLFKIDSLYYIAGVVKELFKHH